MFKARFQKSHPQLQRTSPLGCEQRMLLVPVSRYS